MSTQPAPLPPTSLIICSRNRPDLLYETVLSVLAGDALPSEIVIIDQSDEPHARLEKEEGPEHCEIRYLWSRSAGTSRARNAGIAAARHDVLVFTDDDVYVTPEWFGTLVRAAAQAGPGVVVTGQVRPADAGEHTGEFVPSTIMETQPILHRGRIAQDVIYPHNLAMHREAMERIGPYDLRLGGGAPYPAAEDNDVCHRLLEAGYAIQYLPDAVVYHRAWRSLRDYLPLRWSYGRGQGAFYAKHMNVRDRYMLRRFGTDVLHRTVRIFRRWRQPYGALGEAVYIAGLVSGVASFLVRHRRRESA